MRQEQAGNEAKPQLGRGPEGGSDRGLGREAGRGPEGMRPFPVVRHAGLYHQGRVDAPAPPQAGPAEAGFGSQAFTSGQRARWTLGSMVGRSPSMERTFLQMRYLAGHLRCALMEGERGTGKQLAARTLHELGPVRDRAFVSALADEFLSGAQAAAALEQARGGTLYLHSVDTLNHEQQSRLLHLLGWVQQQQTQGARAAAAAGAPSSAPRALLVSSRRALRPLVLYGKFRSDLQQQLSAVQLTLPPLRDRRDDIPMLVELFLARYAASYGKRMRGVAQDALAQLLHYPWPHNVAELDGVISRAVLRADGDCLRVRDLQLPARNPEDLAGHTPAPAPDRAEPVESAGERTDRVRHGSPEPSSTDRAAGMRPSAVPSFKASPQPQVVPGRAFGSERDRSSGLHVRPDMRPDMRPNMRADVRRTGTEPAFGRSSVAEAPAAQAADAPFDANLDRAVMRHIQQVLATTGGNKLRTARLLGISRSTLYRLLDAHAVAHGSAGALGLRRTDKPA